MRRPCIVDFNIITYIGSVSEHLLIIIWGEGFSHLGFTHFRNPSEILSAIFGSGALWFISTRSNELFSQQSFTTIQFCFHGRGALLVVFQPTNYFSIYQFYYTRNNNFYLNQFYNNSYICSIRHINQNLQFI